MCVAEQYAPALSSILSGEVDDRERRTMVSPSVTLRSIAGLSGTANGGGTGRLE
jgi:hypothetical protein